MTPQLEWVAMFMVGVCLAWLIMRAFGLVVLVGVLMLGMFGECGAEGPDHWLTVENRLPEAVNVTVFEDTTTSRVYDFTFGNSRDVASGTSETFPLDGSISGKGWVSGYYYGSLSSFYAAFPDGPSNNVFKFTYVAPDGRPYWDGTGPFGEGGLYDTNAPWVMTGVSTNDTVMIGSNSYGGISYGYSNTANSRDAAGGLQIRGQAEGAGQQLGLMYSNSWPGEAVSNAFSVAGAGVAFNADDWIIPASGLWKEFNADPHQWNRYNAMSAWSKLLWQWMITIGWIWYVSSELDAEIAKAFMVQGNHSMSSIGGVIQGVIFGVTFGAVMLALPLLLWTAYATLAVNDGAPGQPVGALFIDGPGYIQHKAAISWTLINEWFPAVFIISSSLYWLVIRNFSFPIVRNIQMFIIRIATCWILLAGLCSAGGETRVVLAGEGAGLTGASYPFGWCDYRVEDPTRTFIFTSAFGLMASVVWLPDGMTNAVCTLRDSNGVSFAQTVQQFSAQTNGLVVVGGGGIWAGRASSAVDVDGIQAMLEGLAFGSISLGTLAWVRKMRRWASSAGQRLDL